MRGAKPPLCEPPARSEPYLKPKNRARAPAILVRRIETTLSPSGPGCAPCRSWGLQPPLGGSGSSC